MRIREEGEEVQTVGDFMEVKRKKTNKKYYIRTMSFLKAMPLTPQLSYPEFLEWFVP